MMKNKILTLLAVACLFTSCTENQMAKQFGGTMKVDLPPNTEFVNTTWKYARTCGVCQLGPCKYPHAMLANA